MGRFITPVLILLLVFSGSAKVRPQASGGTDVPVQDTGRMIGYSGVTWFDLSYDTLRQEVVARRAAEVYHEHVNKN